MSRDDGFPRADIDVGIDDDPKVRALRRRLRGDSAAMYRHGFIYMMLITKSWGAGERLTVDDVPPAWEGDDVAGVRANLAAVDLVDAEGRIPEHVWQSWFTPAFGRREALRERWRRHDRRRRPSKAGEQAELLKPDEAPPRSPRGHDGGARVGPTHPGPSGPALPDIPTVPTVPTVTPGALVRRGTAHNGHDADHERRRKSAIAGLVDGSITGPSAAKAMADYGITDAEAGR